MQNVDFILKNVKIKLGARSDADLMSFFGVKPGTISAWRTRNSMNYDLLITKCSEYGFDLQEIILGESTERSQPEQQIVNPKSTDNHSDNGYVSIILDLKAELIKLSKENGRLEEQIKALKKQIDNPANNEPAA